MDSRLEQDRDEIADVLGATLDEALSFLAGLDERPAAVDPGEPEPTRLPERGLGARQALARFRRLYGRLLSGSPGPRYFAFVTGGATPAAVAGDWLTSVYDQNAQLNRDTVAPYVEREAVGFLRDLLGLPEEMTGAFVSGATVASFVGLATGRQVLGQRLGVDVAQEGLWRLGRIPVFSGTGHSSLSKGLSMAGMGRGSLEPVACLPGREAVDPAVLEAKLAGLDGGPALVVANAGTVNTTDFDDLEAIGALKERYGFWLHVDAAFGLFAACSPEHRHLVAGIEAADSITVDGHKWLNVPYDSAVVFTRHLPAQIEVFNSASSYLAPPAPLPHNYMHMVPENSRRFRALAAWMSLLAYGREGYREMVERTCRLARALGERIEASDEYRLLAPVRLNVVCFTLAGEPTPERVSGILDHLKADGRAFLTGSTYQDQPAIRCAFSNWRTEDEDVEVTWGALLDAVAL